MNTTKHTLKTTGTITHRRQYTDSEKQAAVCDYYRNGTSIADYSRETGIPYPSLYRWITEFSRLNPDTIQTMRNKNDYTHKLETENELLRKELEALHKQSAQAMLRAHALDKMIDVAERMFDIPIRKKAGTKQLKSLSQKSRNKKLRSKKSVHCLVRANKPTINMMTAQ